MVVGETIGFVWAVALAVACTLILALVFLIWLRPIARIVRSLSRQADQSSAQSSIEELRASLLEALARPAADPEDVATIERMLVYARDQRIAELTDRLRKDDQLFEKLTETLSVLMLEIRQTAPEAIIAERDELKIAVTDCEKRLAEAQQGLRSAFAGVEKMGKLLANHSFAR